MLFRSGIGLVGVGAAGTLFNKFGISSAEAAEAQTLKPDDEKVEAGTSLGEYLLGGAGIGVGTAISNYPKQAWELAKKAVIKPLALSALPFWKAKQVIGETIKSVKEKKLPDYELTDPNTWMHAAFWNWAVKEWGLTKTLDQFSKANIPGKAKILSHVVARGGLSPNLVKFISSRVAWPVAGIMSVYDAYKDYKRTDAAIKKRWEDDPEGMKKQAMEDAEIVKGDTSEMFAMGGIASLIK